MVVVLWVRLPAFLAVDFLMNTPYVDVRFNDRWHTFTPSAAKGGQVAPMQADMV